MFGWKCSIIICFVYLIISRLLIISWTTFIHINFMTILWSRTCQLFDWVHIFKYLEFCSWFNTGYTLSFILLCLHSFEWWCYGIFFVLLREENGISVVIFPSFAVCRYHSVWGVKGRLGLPMFGLWLVFTVHYFLFR